jgi:hypothetical protein
MALAVYPQHGPPTAPLLSGAQMLLLQYMFTELLPSNGGCFSHHVTLLWNAYDLSLKLSWQGITVN